jgi:hypothetical protein
MLVFVGVFLALVEVDVSLASALSSVAHNNQHHVTIRGNFEGFGVGEHARQYDNPHPNSPSPHCREPRHCHAQRPVSRGGYVVSRCFLLRRAINRPPNRINTIHPFSYLWGGVRLGIHRQNKHHHPDPRQAPNAQFRRRRRALDRRRCFLVLFLAKPSSARFSRLST